MKNTLNNWYAIVGALTSFCLISCGGSSSTSNSTTQSPKQTATITGSVVINQAIKNAVVCMDLNNNGKCDTGEPTSVKTGADGLYSISYDPDTITKSQVSASSLIAVMVPGLISDPATTIDAADSTVGNTKSAFVLKQIQGKSGQINPLTTLAQAGVASGMTEAVARQNLAIQLGIAETKIDDYQSDASITTINSLDSARGMASIVKLALESGATLEVGDQAAALAGGEGRLFNLTYTSSGTYYFREFNYLDKPAGAGLRAVSDSRSNYSNNFFQSDLLTYPYTILNSSGWVWCDRNKNRLETIGNPNRRDACGSHSVIYKTATKSVSGLSMADVVVDIQKDPALSSIYDSSGGNALLTALGSNTLPANSNMANYSYTSISRDITVQYLGCTLNPANYTIENLLNKAPGYRIPLGAHDASKSISLRASVTATTDPTSGTVQFYQCSVDQATGTLACTATETGTYKIEPITGGRILRFFGHAPTTSATDTVYVEVPAIPYIAPQPTLCRGEEGKPDLAFANYSNSELNLVAWNAMKTLLGLK